jgi:hypothetical protein
MLVQVLSQNYLSAVWYCEDHDFSYDDSYYFYGQSVWFINLGHIDLVIDDSYLHVTDITAAGAYNILDVFLDCFDYVHYHLGMSQVPDQAVTIWDNLDESSYTSSYHGFTANGVPGFYIASQANYLGNWDEWDRAVLAHEYGHCVMYTYLEDIPGGGPWSFLEPDVQSGDANDLGLGLSEGWANLFSAVVRSDPVFVNTVVGDDDYDVKNFETPYPDAPYYSYFDITDPLLPPPAVRASICWCPRCGCSDASTI